MAIKIETPWKKKKENAKKNIYSVTNSENKIFKFAGNLGLLQVAKLVETATPP